MLSFGVAYIWKTTVQWEIESLNCSRDKNVGFAANEGIVISLLEERNNKSLK